MESPECRRKMKVGEAEYAIAVPELISLGHRVRKDTWKGLENVR